MPQVDHQRERALENENDERKKEQVVNPKQIEQSIKSSRSKPPLPPRPAGLSLKHPPPKLSSASTISPLRKPTGAPNDKPTKDTSDTPTSTPVTTAASTPSETPPTSTASEAPPTNTPSEMPSNSITSETPTTSTPSETPPTSTPSEMPPTSTPTQTTPTHKRDPPHKVNPSVTSSNGSHAASRPQRPPQPSNHGSFKATTAPSRPKPPDVARTPKSVKEGVSAPEKPRSPGNIHTSKVIKVGNSAAEKPKSPTIIGSFKASKDKSPTPEKPRSPDVCRSQAAKKLKQSLDVDRNIHAAEESGTCKVEKTVTPPEKPKPPEISRRADVVADKMSVAVKITSPKVTKKSDSVKERTQAPGNPRSPEVSRTSKVVKTTTQAPARPKPPEITGATNDQDELALPESNNAPVAAVSDSKKLNRPPRPVAPLQTVHTSENADSVMHERPRSSKVEPPQKPGRLSLFSVSQGEGGELEQSDDKTDEVEPALVSDEDHALLHQPEKLQGTEDPAKQVEESAGGSPKLFVPPEPRRSGEIKEEEVAETSESKEGEKPGRAFPKERLGSPQSSRHRRPPPSRPAFKRKTERSELVSNDKLLSSDRDFNKPEVKSQPQEKKDEKSREVGIERPSLVIRAKSFSKTELESFKRSSCPEKPKEVARTPAGAALREGEKPHKPPPPALRPKPQRQWPRPAPLKRSENRNEAKKESRGGASKDHEGLRKGTTKVEEEKEIGTGDEHKSERDSRKNYSDGVIKEEEKETPTTNKRVKRMAPRTPDDLKDKCGTKVSEEVVAITGDQKLGVMVGKQEVHGEASEHFGGDTSEKGTRSKEDVDLSREQKGSKEDTDCRSSKQGEEFSDESQKEREKSRSLDIVEAVEQGVVDSHEGGGNVKGTDKRGSFDVENYLSREQKKAQEGEEDKKDVRVAKSTFYTEKYLTEDKSVCEKTGEVESEANEGNEATAGLGGEDSVRRGAELSTSDQDMEMKHGLGEQKDCAGLKSETCSVKDEGNNKKAGIKKEVDSEKETVKQEPGLSEEDEKTSCQTAEVKPSVEEEGVSTILETELVTEGRNIEEEKPGLKDELDEGRSEERTQDEGMRLDQNADEEKAHEGASDVMEIEIVKDHGKDDGDSSETRDVAASLKEQSGEQSDPDSSVTEPKKENQEDSSLSTKIETVFAESEPEKSVGETTVNDATLEENQTIVCADERGDLASETMLVSENKSAGNFEDQRESEESLKNGLQEDIRRIGGEDTGIQGGVIEDSGDTGHSDSGEVIVTAQVVSVSESAAPLRCDVTDDLRQDMSTSGVATSASRGDTAASREVTSTSLGDTGESRMDANTSREDTSASREDGDNSCEDPRNSLEYTNEPREDANTSENEKETETENVSRVITCDILEVVNVVETAAKISEPLDIQHTTSDSDSKVVQALEIPRESREHKPEKNEEPSDLPSVQSPTRKVPPPKPKRTSSLKKDSRLLVNTSEGAQDEPKGLAEEDKQEKAANVDHEVSRPEIHKEPQMSSARSAAFHDFVVRPKGSSPAVDRSKSFSASKGRLKNMTGDTKEAGTKHERVTGAEGLLRSFSFAGKVRTKKSQPLRPRPPTFFIDQSAAPDVAPEKHEKSRSVEDLKATSALSKNEGEDDGSSSGESKHSSLNVEESKLDTVSLEGSKRDSVSTNDSKHNSLAVENTTDSETDSEKEDVPQKSKTYYISREILSTEKTFVDTLKLVSEDFMAALEKGNKKFGRAIIPSDVLHDILMNISQIYDFDREFLKALELRMETWDENQRIGDIIKKFSPFLKMYKTYIQGYDNAMAVLTDALRKYPQFAEVVREFECSERCQNLTVAMYMLKPIQRIPSYRLLLIDYLKHLFKDSLDYEDVSDALAIVSDVATHINEDMKRVDNFEEVLKVQRSLVGQVEIVKPGRELIKEGALMKLCRKDMQPRMFYLFTDVLLYTTPVANNQFRLNVSLPLEEIKVDIPASSDFDNEFSIISTKKSFTLLASTPDERDEWLEALRNASDEIRKKKITFQLAKKERMALLQAAQDGEDKDAKLGSKAPVWIPDARVSMCMVCTDDFTVTNRRHHCRACGKVICGSCSSNSAPLEYLNFETARVCDYCFDDLNEANTKSPPSTTVTENGDTSEGIDTSSKDMSVRKSPTADQSHRSKKNKKFSKHKSKEVPEVKESVISGYLRRRIGKKWHKRWYLLKDNVLYTSKASSDVAAQETCPLLGYDIRGPEKMDGDSKKIVFQLIHQGTEPVVLQTDNIKSAEQWVNALRRATILPL